MRQRGFDRVQEHDTSAAMVPSGQSVRWWTCWRDGETIEVVRCEYHTHGLVTFIVLPTGAYAFPALAHVTLKAGRPGLKRLEELGGRLVPLRPHGGALGRALEQRLVGRG